MSCRRLSERQLEILNYNFQDQVSFFKGAFSFDFNNGDSHSVVLSDVGGHWAGEAIGKLASAGVLAGYGDGTFKPNKTISREEMVIILSRIVKRKHDSGTVPIDHRQSAWI
ncbi:S-layer homology domain-containing protein [Cohnella endophytica]|uniref:S-layer homology domain-containing protein n=1 Tax=Cohnella endophytica TaxID=2419778 RepID=UPI002D773F29|nr:S-layer homology domain-containing protein [Cohnella endophytica]